MKNKMTIAYEKAEAMLINIIRDTACLSVSTRSRVFCELHEHWIRRLSESETEAQRMIARRCINRTDKEMVNIRFGFKENPLAYAGLQWPKNMPARKEVDIIECKSQNREHDKIKDCCEDCPYHYELTEEQKTHYDGSCGCTSLESTGHCWKADQAEYE